MGLFQHKQAQKQSPDDQAADAVDHFFDDEFREYLRDRGRVYFERVINENAMLFKQDLDATVAHINTELKQHMARQLDDQFAEISRVNAELKEHLSRRLDEQFAEYAKTMKDAQDQALETLSHSAQVLEEQHKQLSVSLEKSIAQQDALLTGAVNESKSRIDDMQATQDKALESLNRSVEALEEQHKHLSSMLEMSVTKQETILVDAFQHNMARIVEHYLLTAVGEKYDLKAQLPSIIQQMEANKQAIVDDMKL